MIRKLLKKLRRKDMCVILDPKDNSVTFSHDLFEHIKENSPDTGNACAFVFRTTDNYFGFVINPDLKDTQLNYIQVNEKHKCIGFETLCPTVGRIFYDYGIPPLKKPVKLAVTYKDAAGTKYYRIEKPKL